MTSSPHMPNMFLGQRLFYCSDSLRLCVTITGNYLHMHIKYVKRAQNRWREDGRVEGGTHAEDNSVFVSGLFCFFFKTLILTGCTD